MRTMRKRAVTKSAATPGQMRIALENVMRDILSGELSGRNPWTLDSVKDASETLTGKEWSKLESKDIPRDN